MFTGLIEAVGEVREIRPNPSSLSLVLETTLAAELRPGDSLAVNGVCLTVVRVTADNVYVDVGPETARVTTLAAARPGQPVNLERAMRADGRFGGHIVQGHIDGTGVVDRIRDDGDAHWLTISLDGELARRLIPKGSIAVDGISLTIAALHPAAFDAMIVPFTWVHTNVRALRGDPAVLRDHKQLARAVVDFVHLNRDKRATKRAGHHAVNGYRTIVVTPRVVLQLSNAGPTRR